ncbi:hypothetical protein PYW07_011328 [Mythimna separata]|uniref:Uncharacterized protein n=1 Tax=Mythimna separata TaxID=271217 RepID=A0AAD7Y955_MYTSE|nr:hypothetical protein PYW07_011328 [Mythimna separata]
MSTPVEGKEKKEEKPRRVKEDSGRTRRVRNEASEGKVEAYLRQYQVSMRQQQHRHSAVRQAEHRVNLRSLPLNDVATARGHDRTPTDRHRGFPERDREGSREHRRERDRDRERERDPFDFDGTPLSPIAPRAHDKESRPVRKSSSAHKVTETSISTDKRRFFCREWAFQKIAHCLEQRPVSKTCGALILGDAGSGKTALCQELSEPGQGPQARQQRALNRRLLARHFLQSHTESSLRPGEFVRTLAMQILSHSSRRARADNCDLSPRLSETQTHSHTESSLRPGEFVRTLAMQILSHSSRRARADNCDLSPRLSETQTHSHTESSLRPGEFVRTLAMQILSHSSRRARADNCDLSPRLSETQTHSHTESSLRPGEFVRTLAMQILSHSSRRARADNCDLSPRLSETQTHSHTESSLRPGEFVRTLAMQILSHSSRRARADNCDLSPRLSETQTHSHTESSLRPGEFVRTLAMQILSHSSRRARADNCDLSPRLSETQTHSHTESSLRPGEFVRTLAMQILSHSSRRARADNCDLSPRLSETQTHSHTESSLRPGEFVRTLAMQILSHSSRRARADNCDLSPRLSETQTHSHTESSLRPGEFVRTLAMQILSHSSRRARADNCDLSPRLSETQTHSHTESSLRPGEFVRTLAMQILSHSSRRARADNCDLSPRLSETQTHSHTESSLRPGEFVRTLAMQILSHSSRRARADNCDLSPRLSETQTHRRNSEEERLISRFRDLGDDGEESSKPLLADSEDQRTDDEDVGPSGRRTRTIHRIHEREEYKDLHADAPLSNIDDLPEILPRSSVKPTNPFVTDEKDDLRLYENHENLFLRNISQRQSKELRNSRLLRQSSEPLSEKKANVLQKSLSTEQKNDSSGEERKVENSPPKSRIPVANFRYPNKSDLRSAESSPAKTKPERPSTPKEELPEYQNILKPEGEDVAEKVEKRKEEDVPPPIPSLPISPRTLIANAYYDKLLSEPEIQQALLPQNLEKNPDECFKKALLFPLLEIDPPKQCLFLLVDAIDEGILGGICEEREGTEGSSSVASLLSRHQHLFPQWLLLVCTARKHCRNLTRMFTGFRKITLDELQRAHVSADVQRYVLSRLDTEPRLRARVSSDSTAAAAAAAALDNLRIKSDGCLLYLEKVLDGVADGFIALREIREIPGTLNGLYLWLAQRLFHGRRFTKVRLLLDVLLAARCGVTEEMLYKCLLTKEYSVTREDFNRRLHLLRRILVMERSTGFLSMFHHSFAKWLVDVKHCTRRYLCCPTEGHAAIAMYYTLDAKRLSALEIHNYVFHMTSLEQHMASQKKNKNTEQKEDELDLHTLILLWVLDSGCDVESALRRESDSHKQLENDESLKQDPKSEEKDGDPESEGKDSLSGE